MTPDFLKLTTYFGERQRTGRGLVADELLALYGRHEVALSVLLRGVEGFGLKHHLRSDRMLTLSEDLPVVAVAVDTRERIDSLAGEVLGLERHGLVTFERARMGGANGERGERGEQGEPAPPARSAEQTKLTIYVGRQERLAGRPAFVAVCELLHRHGVAGATALLGVDGTLGGRRQRARFLARNANVPIMVIAVGDGEPIAHALLELAAMAPRPPLFTLERVTVCKRDGELLARPELHPTAPLKPGLRRWQKLMIYTWAHAEHGGSPLHVALVRALRQNGARGATCLRGIWGYHGDHPPHGDRLLQLRRRVPVVTVVVQPPEDIDTSFAIVDELTREAGLVTSELVPVVLGEGGER